MLMDSCWKQRTINREISCKGIGLHSGKEVSITLSPASVNEGIVFVRRDLEGSPVVPALYHLVVDTQLCTRLENAEGVSVATVEHVMAALWACGLDNVRVELSGPEVPIMDGSSQVFIGMIEEAGICAQPAYKNLIVVEKDIEYRDDKGGYACLSPVGEMGLFADISLNYGDDVIGEQSLRVALTEDFFKEEIAQARTFGFLKEAEYLWSKGLALGASLDNTVVIDEGHILNEEGLRFDNEFVRHKLLDFCGDIALVPGRLIGQFKGFKAGHGLHNQMLRVLFSHRDNYRVIPADQFCVFYEEKCVA